MTYFGVGISIIESFDQSVSNRVSSCLESIELREIEPMYSNSVLNVINNLPFNLLYIVSNVIFHQKPQFLVSFLLLLRHVCYYFSFAHLFGDWRYGLILGLKNKVGLKLE